MWVALPHCDLHGGEELARISVYAISKYRGEICGASPSFCEALQTLSKPPSDDILGAIDAGPAEDAETFLDEIDRSTVKTSQEFLRDLEGDKDR